MKKSVYSIIAAIAVVFALVSCAKQEAQDIDEVTPSEVREEQEPLIEVTIIAGNPEAEPTTKTEMVGSAPYWSVGDKIGVATGTNETQYLFTTGISSPSTTASFTGDTVSGDLYAYYPYSSYGLNKSGQAKVLLPTDQYPTSNSFDGSGDIMVAKQFTVSPSNTTVSDLQFARLGAIVKLVLIDKNSTMVGTQCPSQVSMTAESNLAGRVYVDMTNQELGDIYYGASTTVNANYTAETKYEINGTNATYLVVYPQILAEGSTLTITASTEDYNIEKEITVPSGGIELLPGKVNTLNINLLSSHITAKPSGSPLPFTDNMSWANNGADDSSSDISSSIASAENSNGLYVSATKAYKGIGGLKLGTSSANGSITTKDLDLRGAFYIAILGGQYGDDTGTLEVTVDDTKVITGGSISGVSYVNISAGTYSKTSHVTIATSTKRGYIYSVKIKSGTYVPDPVITVTSDNPMDVSNENDMYAIEYTISNPTGASITASANVAWIHDFDYSVDGEVSFEVDAQSSGAAARDGIITLSYTDARDVNITVNQAAGAGAAATLYLESFGDNGSSNTAVSSATTYTALKSMFTDPSNSVVSHYSSAGKVGKNNVDVSTGYSGVSGKSAVWYTPGSGNSTSNLFTVDKIDISSASGITISFGLLYKNGTIGTTNTVNVYYKVDSGAEKTLSFTQPTSNTWTLCSGAIAETGSSLKIRFEMVTTGGYTVRLDDIKVVGTK